MDDGKYLRHIFNLIYSITWNACLILLNFVVFSVIQAELFKVKHNMGFYDMSYMYMRLNY